MVARSIEPACQGRLSICQASPTLPSVPDAAVRLNLEITEGLNDPLAVIGGIVDASRAIESTLREWVRVARAKGHTWQEIAHALHVSRQSAWQRFKTRDNR